MPCQDSHQLLSNHQRRKARGKHTNFESPIPKTPSLRKKGCVNLTLLLLPATSRNTQPFNEIKGADVF